MMFVLLSTAILAMPLALAARPGSGVELAAPPNVGVGASYDVAVQLTSGSPILVDFAPGNTAPPSAVSRLLLVVSTNQVVEVTLGQKVKPPARDFAFRVFVSPDATPGSDLQFTIGQAKTGITHII